MKMAMTATTAAETLAMMTLSKCIQCVERLAVTSRSSTNQSTNVSKPWRR
jgi:hypothetical protein